MNMRNLIKPIIRKTKISKNGLHTIFIQYCYTTAKRVVLSTGISIPSTYWDKRACVITPSLPAQYGSPKSLQETVESLQTKAERIINYATKKNLGCPMQ